MRPCNWHILQQQKQQQEQLSRDVPCSPFLAKLLLNRGIDTPQEAEAFLYPKWEQLSSPFEILNMGAACEKIWESIQQQEKIVVYGDYDVDGICATVILSDALRKLGAQVDYYIPNRQEGYGLNEDAIQKLYDAGTKMLITVDCGISGANEVQSAKKMGMKVIVTDHHQLPQILPDCIVINPALASVENETWKYLCGAGVGFMLVMALYEWRYDASTARQAAKEWLDLAAIATIADMVPLWGDNRIITKYGLEEMKRHRRVGLDALCQISGGSKMLQEISVGTISFGIAPRLNASGRIGQVKLGVELLLAENKADAQTIAALLDGENRTRQEIEKQIYDEALAQLAQNKKDICRGIIVVGENWHPGVIGIVASRIMEKFYTPTIVLTEVNGIYKGSGRSIQGFHLQQALVECEDLLENYGGHAQAAGLGIKKENLAAFIERFGDLVEKSDSEIFTPQIVADCVLNTQDISFDLLQEMNKLEPFGIGNTAPLFVLRGQIPQQVREVGEYGDHLRMKLNMENGDIVAMAFKKAHMASIARSGAVDMVFGLEKNVFNGKTTLQMLLKDIKPCQYPDEVDLQQRLFCYWEKYLQDNPYQGIEQADAFYTKVVGVSFEDRQDKIALLEEGQTLTLRREKENPYDKNAIAVDSQAGQIGYLKRELAAELALHMDRGVQYAVTVSQRTGEEGQTKGVNIYLQKHLSNMERWSEAMQIQRQQIASLPPSEQKQRIQQAIIGENPYRPKQQEALLALEQGKNVLCIMGTGRGKSAIFQSYGAYLALQQKKITILVYPLRALVNDQYESLRAKMQKLCITVRKATGELTSEQRADFWASMRKGQADIILTTPEFLQCNEDRLAQFGAQIGLIVIDEAHHLHTRRSGYRRLPQVLKNFSAQILAVSATADAETMHDMCEQIAFQAILVDEHVRSNLILDDRRNEKSKMDWLCRLVQSGEKTIVYVNSRRKAAEIAQDLQARMPQGNMRKAICYYHGGLTAIDRQAIEKNFRDGIFRCIVTTSAFGEGIDIADIDHVVLYHLSFSCEEYNQLAGRAGRGGQTAYVHLLYNERDKRVNDLLLESSCPQREPLVEFYKQLKSLVKDGEITLTNQELADSCVKKIKGISAEAVSHWLGIFEELNFLTRERMGNKRKILLADKPAKTSLEASLRFQEGLAERNDYDQYLDLAFDKDRETLLQAMNRPIYPKNYQDYIRW